MVTACLEGRTRPAISRAVRTPGELVQAESLPFWSQAVTQHWEYNRPAPILRREP